MKINFISSKEDSDETHTIHTKSGNVQVMMGSEADEIIEELFKSLKQIYIYIKNRTINGRKSFYV